MSGEGIQHERIFARQKPCWKRAFVARGFIPVGVRSAPLYLPSRYIRLIAFSLFGGAAQPNGDKSPRHNCHQSVGRRSRLTNGQPPSRSGWGYSTNEFLSDKNLVGKGLLWRGDLSPLGCAAPPLYLSPRYIRLIAFSLFGAAAQPNGDKSPRHKGSQSVGRRSGPTNR